MLASIEVVVYPKSDCVLPHPGGYLLHAALLNLIRQDNPALSEELHDDSQVKPFSISTLWPRSRAKGDSMTIPKYTACRFRICTLSRKVFDAFSKVIFTRLAVNGSINLRGEEFTVIEAGMEPPRGGVATYEELWQELDDDKAVVRFVSPTMFRSRGMGVSLPVPALVYGSLWQKWQAFSSVQVDEKVFEEMAAVLALSKADIHTRAWKYPNYILTGFTGTVEYELVRPVSIECRKLFGALSRLAFYSGIGYRTTMGMGQCRFLENSVQSDNSADNPDSPEEIMQGGVGNA